MSLSHVKISTHRRKALLLTSILEGGAVKMAKCAICEKAAHFGNNVSHSHRRSNKRWKANVKSVRVKVNGANQRMYVCTSCLRSGKVERA